MEFTSQVLTVPDDPMGCQREYQDAGTSQEFQPWGLGVEGQDWTGIDSDRDSDSGRDWDPAGAVGDRCRY
jgi:hypothetical protein